MSEPARPRPALLLAVEPEQCPTVTSEFQRYARDYEVVCVESADEAREAAARMQQAGQPVALLGVG